MKLFIYGMLQEESVITNLINRVPSMSIAYLKGYALKLSWCVFYATPQVGSYVNGRVIEVTEKELEVIDAFEGGYKRIEVNLFGGTKAYVYVIK